jgi:hypothetical protein
VDLYSSNLFDCAFPIPTARFRIEKIFLLEGMEGAASEGETTIPEHGFGR